MTLSFPAIRNYIREEFSKNIEKQFGKPDVIAGVATGAIGIGMLVAEYMGLPFVYVRPEPKKHGRENQVEGFLQKGQNVVVVEDLISTGNSSLHAVDALRATGANVKGMVAIFTYGFDIADENFKNDIFNFALKGMPEIKLRLKDKTPHSKIVLSAASDKLPFTLIASIDAVSDTASQVKLDFEGEFNPMMAMMIKGPITKFLETLTQNMNKL
jgi:orotate phosphoribosyltransferase